MKNKIIFLVCAVFLTVACEKEQHTGKESRVSVTVYDENGKAMPGIPVKMYDEKDYKAFEQDNLTPPTAGATANAQGIALFTLPGEVWFSGQSQRFLTFVVQEGGGPDNYRIWSVGKTIDADFHFRHRFDGAGGGYGFRYLAFDYGGCLVGHFMFGRGAAEKPDAYAGYHHNGYGDKDNLFLVHILYIIIGF